jgi:flagellar hook assembly protein FlgD
MYMVRSTDPTDPRQMAPWKVPLKGITTQKNGVTILHNVIDPTQGQKVQILYSMKRSGVVTAEVFALDGSAVKVLQRGRQAAGDYSLFWDGRNDSGDVVARGVYFIRVVAPDIDETRNLMVIK